jgi:hypothetical protein
VVVISCTVLALSLTEKESLISTVYGRLYKYSKQDYFYSWSRVGAKGANKGESVGQIQYSLILKQVVHTEIIVV